MRSIYYSRIIKIHALNLGEGKNCYMENFSRILYNMPLREFPLRKFFTYKRVGAKKYA